MVILYGQSFPELLDQERDICRLKHLARSTDVYTSAGGHRAGALDDQKPGFSSLKEMKVQRGETRFLVLVRVCFNA